MGAKRPGQVTRSPGCVRRASLAKLLALLDGIVESQPKIVEVTGEPGIGKTRLLSYLSTAARERGIRVISTRCAEPEQDVPFQAFAYIIRSLLAPEMLQQMPSGTGDMVKEVFDASEWYGNHRWRQRNGRYRILNAINALLERAAVPSLMIILDDFHWADAASIELIDHLVRFPPAGPFLLVVSHRRRQASHHLRSVLAHAIETGVVELLELEPLDVEQSAEILGMPGVNSRLAHLHEASGGNPLYLLALAQMGWSDVGDSEGAALQSTAVNGQVTAHFAALLMSELSALDGPQTASMNASAVLGGRFDIEAISEVAMLTVPEVTNAVRELVRRDLLRQVGNMPYFMLRHIVLRNVIYFSMDSAWRVEAHQRALALLEGRNVPAAVQAIHVEGSITEPGHDHQRILVTAARDTMRSAPAISARWLQIALRSRRNDDVHDPQHVELMLMHSRALGIAGKLAESCDLLDEVLRLLPAERSGMRASAVSFFALMASLLGRYAEADARIAAELAVTTTSPPLQRVELHVMRGLVGLMSGSQLNREDSDLALYIAAQYPDQRTMAGALALSALTEALAGDVAAGVPKVEEAACLADRFPDSELVSRPEYLVYLTSLGWAELLLGQFGCAERHLRRGASLAARCGHTYVLSLFLCGLSASCRMQGRLEDAMRVASEARDSAAYVQAEHLTGLALTQESLTALWTQPRESGYPMELAQRAVRLLPRGACRWSVTAAMSVASVALLAGDPHRCKATILNAAVGPELGALPPLFRATAYEQLAAAETEIGEDGSKWAARAAEEAWRDGSPLSKAAAWAAEAHTLRVEGKYETALVLYRRAADTLAVIGAINFQARVLIFVAICAFAMGGTQEASTAMALAKELATQCGAGRLVSDINALAKSQVVVQGGSRADTGALFALTPREREVAWLAASGRRTREIAAKLSLSPRTVDVHLTSIYRKLNVNSRVSLALLMTEQRPPDSPAAD